MAALKSSKWSGGLSTSRMFSRLVERGDRARDGRSWARAAAAYAEALEINPGKVAIWVQYGHALKELGQLASSEVSYRHALSLDPSIADTYLQLGHVLKLQGRIREAAENYFTSWQLEPNLEWAKVELSHLGYSESAMSEALKTGVLPGRPYLEDEPAKSWNIVAEGVHRLRIDRGWLYRTYMMTSAKDVVCAMTFVPD